jgi:hypothetical protein
MKDQRNVKVTIRADYEDGTFIEIVVPKSTMELSVMHNTECFYGEWDLYENPPVLSEKSIEAKIKPLFNGENSLWTFTTNDKQYQVLKPYSLEGFGKLS